MKVMVTGSREWADEVCVYDALDRLLERSVERGDGEFVLMEGGAEGADEMAKEWAQELAPEVTHDPFPPDEKLPSPQRFHARNDAMLARADYVVAFWDGKSRGTKSVIDKAVKRDLHFEVHAPEGVEIA